jgi:Leucine-rich repeat (LRR) protein
VPVEISKCHKLRELDLKNTYVITLPREMANLTSLLLLTLDGCPLKESLANTYSEGMASIHTDFRRKEDRKHFKEQLFDHLTEWVYPSIPKEKIFEVIEQIFGMLKDCNSEMLKKLQRNS